MVPYTIKQFSRDDFMNWIWKQGGAIVDQTNPYEVVRYKFWDDDMQSRPSTHIVYKRKNDTLTYTGYSRDHYEAFLKDGTWP